MKTSKDTQITRLQWFHDEVISYHVITRSRGHWISSVTHLYAPDEKPRWRRLLRIPGWGNNPIRDFRRRRRRHHHRRLLRNFRIFWIRVRWFSSPSPGGASGGADRLLTCAGNAGDGDQKTTTHCAPRSQATSLLNQWPMLFRKRAISAIFGT